MDKLKPCPFCGGKASIEICGDMSWVQCEHCGAKQDEHCGNNNVIINNWNTRINQQPAASNGERPTGDR